MSSYISLDRKFSVYSKDNEKPEIDWEGIWRDSDHSFCWQGLLEKKYAVVLAEAGSGKTEEFKNQAKSLIQQGCFSFFCRLEYLAKGDFDPFFDFDIGDGESFDSWLESDQVAYFFLDSVDEAKLQSPSALREALKVFVHLVGRNNLHRACVFMSSRYSEWDSENDLKMFCQALQLPLTQAVKDKEQVTYVFRLEALDENQIKAFAATRFVKEVGSFWGEIERLDAQAFAKRPQDLLGLISYWNHHKALPKSYQEILEHDLQQRLQDDNPNRELILSLEDKQAGVKQLAITITLMRVNKIKVPNKAQESIAIGAICDAEKALPHWSHKKIKELLSLPIFDEEIYGAVRFHHRSIRELLAAQWLQDIKECAQYETIDSLLFAEKYGQKMSIPFMRPIAAWLAYKDNMLCNKLVDLSPKTLFDYGDPAQLDIEFRRHFFEEFIDQYAGQHYDNLRIDPVMLKRFSSPEMSKVINQCLKQYIDNKDIVQLLVSMIQYGKVVKSLSEIIPLVLSENSNKHTKTQVLRTVLSIAPEQKKAELVKQLLQQGSLGYRVLGLSCDLLFPDYLSVRDLLSVITAFPKDKNKLYSDIEHCLLKLFKNVKLRDSEVLFFLSELSKLISEKPYIKESNYTWEGKCEVSKDYGWLAIIAITLVSKLNFGVSKHFSKKVVLEIYWLYFEYLYWNRRSVSSNGEEEHIQFLRDNQKLSFQVFLYVLSKLSPLVSFRSILHRIKNIWEPTLKDWSVLLEELKNNSNRNERFILFQCLWLIYKNEANQYGTYLEELTIAVDDDSYLQVELNNLLSPEPLSPAELEIQKEIREEQEESRLYEEQKLAVQAGWKQYIQKNAEHLLDIGANSDALLWNAMGDLYEYIRERENNNNKGHSYGVSEWEVLIDEYGIEVAENFRDGCKDYWRSQVFESWNVWLLFSGLAIEARESEWIDKLTIDEVEKAFCLGLHELDGLPSWLMEIQSKYPKIAQKAILDEVKYELSGSFDDSYPNALQKVYFSHGLKVDGLQVEILALLEQSTDQAQYKCVKYALGIIFRLDRVNKINKRLSLLARNNLIHAENYISNWCFLWIGTLLFSDAGSGINELRKILNCLPNESEKTTLMVGVLKFLYDEFDKTYYVKVESPSYYGISFLDDLLSLVYQYVCFEDDIHRESLRVYSPTPRDHAQRLRGSLLHKLASIKGRETYTVLLKKANDTNDLDLKNHLKYLAKNRIEDDVDADFEPWSEKSVVELAKDAEKTPRSEKELYQLAINKLALLKAEFEYGDDSMALTVQRETEETKLRIVLANQLRKISNGKYMIAQEEEMPDKKRTDIRFRISSDYALPVELKIADNWSFNDLKERLENQLVKQYMKESNYGIFLLVFRGSKGWKVEGKHTKNLGKLVSVLNTLAEGLVKKHSLQGLKVIGIDLTQRENY